MSSTKVASQPLVSAHCTIPAPIPICHRRVLPVFNCHSKPRDIFQEESLMWPCWRTNDALWSRPTPKKEVQEPHHKRCGLGGTTED